MKVGTGVKIHNRFDIEVRDANTGELKQKGIAENIVLNSMYTSLCNYSKFFVNIHFGTGAGNPSPERTTLFTFLGTRSSDHEEIIREYPTSRVTRKITLMPEEYVDQTFTEVGIATSSSQNSLVTHAMIRDAEGNLLNITKTNIDVIIIYASVFITFVDPSSTFYFSDINTNILVSYFMQDWSSAPISGTGQLAISRGDWNNDILKMNVVGDGHIKSATLTRSISARKNVYTTRFTIDEGNNLEIRSISLKNVGRCILKPNNIINIQELKKVQIGIGDGVTTKFYIPHIDPKNIVIKINNAITMNRTLNNTDRINNPSVKLAIEYFDLDYDPNPSNLYRSDGFNGLPLRSSRRSRCGVFKALESFKDSKIRTTPDMTVKLYGAISPTGPWVLASGEPVTIAGWRYMDIIHPGPYYDFDLFYSSAGGNVYNITMINDIDKEMPSVTFLTPPAIGEILTADYDVDYLPKSEDYVLDVEFTLQFGEGV